MFRWDKNNTGHEALKLTSTFQDPSIIRVDALVQIQLFYSVGVGEEPQPYWQYSAPDLLGKRKLYSYRPGATPKDRRRELVEEVLTELENRIDRREDRLEELRSYRKILKGYLACGEDTL